MMVSTTYVLHVSLKRIGGYINRMTRLVLFLDPMQCILVVGDTVHHAGSRNLQ
jgi:hypothetical protein